MKVTLQNDDGEVLCSWRVPDEQVDCGGVPECIADWVVMSGEPVYEDLFEDSDEKS